MKKIIAIGLLGMTLFALVGCSNTEKTMRLPSVKRPPVSEVIRKPDTQIIVVDSQGKRITNPTEGQIGYCYTESSKITYKYAKGQWQYVSATKIRGYRLDPVRPPVVNK